MYFILTKLNGDRISLYVDDIIGWQDFTYKVNQTEQNCMFMTATKQGCEIVCKIDDTLQTYQVQESFMTIYNLVDINYR